MMTAPLGFDLKCGRNPIARCMGPVILMAISWSALVRSRLFTLSGRWTPAQGWSEVVRVVDVIFD